MLGEKIDEHMAFKLATGCRSYHNTPDQVTEGIPRSTSTYAISELYKCSSPVLLNAAPSPDKKPTDGYVAPFRQRFDLRLMYVKIA
jgi:hypothetical protein